MGPAVLAGALEAVLGQEAPTGEVIGEGAARISVIQWADKSSLDAWDPHPEWLKLGKQEEGSSDSN